MKKLSETQARLLRILPDPPSDGRYCKGGRLRTAESLERMGFARRVSAGYFVGANVRTPEGAKAGVVICPKCKGTGEVGPAFVDGTDSETGLRFGRIQMVRCGACRGDGEVDDGYPARVKDGARARDRRQAQGITLRAAAKIYGLSVVDLSEYERGCSKPDDARRLKAILCD